MIAYFDFAADKGQSPLGISIEGSFSSYGHWNVLRFGPFLSPLPSITDATGRANLPLTLPNDPSFIGTGLLYQALFVTPGQWHASNTTILDIQ